MQECVEFPNEIQHIPALLPIFRSHPREQAVIKSH